MKFFIGIMRGIFDLLFMEQYVDYATHDAVHVRKNLYSLSSFVVYIQSCRQSLRSLHHCLSRSVICPKYSCDALYLYISLVLFLVD